MSINGHPLTYYHMKCNGKLTWFTKNQNLRKNWGNRRAPIFRQIALELGMKDVNELYMLNFKDIAHNGRRINAIQEQAGRIDIYFTKHPDCLKKTWSQCCDILAKNNSKAFKKACAPCMWRIPNLTPHM